ncbi:MAG: 23S rRNA (adenine(2503)-C(2))-methyltransferase RlmN [Candidatus Gastranaerophilales bacterium]|nr:23S rRNA (adenine(2503)-C(2))-methyltransferase RlmN [Candidatus Gastranaerophilales bacterium]
MSKKIILSGLIQQDFEKIAQDLKASKFRARQIHNWIYLKSVKSIDEMTDLSKDFREKLSEIAQVSDVTVKTKQVSEDGTIKYLIGYPDGNCVETVLMRFDNRTNLTACVSSQVGCAINCSFCATGKRGFVRNLTAAEIVEQVLTIQRDTGLKVTNVVFMGQGEPLLNLDNVLQSLTIFNEDFQIGARRITISTSGIIPGINKLAELEMQSTLALSLHAPVSEVRKQIIPVESKYPLAELKEALKNYTNKTGRRITIEYLLIKDLTDTIEMAESTAIFLKDIKCNVNLIPYNPIKDSKFKKPSTSSIMKFKYILEHSGKKVTIRLERGADIDAACGQLTGKVNS